MYLAALKKYTVFFVVTGLLVFINSCKSSGTGPEDNVPAGRRDYVWTVDTLKVPEGDYTLPSRFWGSSANDLWAIGYAYSDYHKIWHYDGIEWKDDSVYRKIDPFAIWGTKKK